MQIDALRTGAFVHGTLVAERDDAPAHVVGETTRTTYDDGALALTSLEHLADDGARVRPAGEDGDVRLGAQGRG